MYKKKAVEEMNIVVACRDKYAITLEELKRSIEESKAKLAVLMERGRLAYDQETKIELARQAKKIKDTLEYLKDDAECFQDNVDRFDDLKTLLDSFFNHERFRFIAKKIPGKKLPAMVRDPNKSEEVNELLLSLIEDFNEAWQLFKLGQKKREERRRHLSETKKIFRERNETKDPELDDILAEMNAGAAQEAPVAAETPVAAEAPVETAAEPAKKNVAKN